MFTGYSSGIQLLNCSKLEKWKWHDAIVKFFDVVLFCILVKFRYWLKFHVKYITGSGVMAILFYKKLTRNLETWITPVLVSPNIWRLEQVRDTKFGSNVSNEMLLNTGKCQGYSIYSFWVIKGKSTGWLKLPLNTYTHFRLNLQLNFFQEWNDLITWPANFLCNFVVRDIKIAVYLESPRKINFNLVSDFLSKWNSSKNEF